MTISSRFSVGIHILSLLEINKAGINSSEMIASSVNTNPVVIRKIMGKLKKAGLVTVNPGIAGAKLSRSLAEISLLDVYKAVEVVQDNELFSIHENPNPDCLVGKHLQEAIEPIFAMAQLALEKVLQGITIEDVVESLQARIITC
ncbi:Rrf2 family transcriptional regulator [Paenibacillus sp. CF384]|uniref:Rrf2 family transcriptional regulator n=1 Tax=Paenibacillus sp. CF384 TaxID=1884382 RepID=UPI0008962FC4|nr:Rrf2 family transcriptional regulator [Paenibacillus sp. CF384]SDW07189.1 DNA-binding transcriptional regulator, IscR family [Paenibacillus sp. CF384]